MVKLKGDNTGCGNVKGLQLSKQRALCKMAYSLEEREQAEHEVLVF
jgi:hypothetical protein